MLPIRLIFRKTGSDPFNFPAEHLRIYHERLRSKFVRVVTTPHPDMPEDQLGFSPEKRSHCEVPDKPHSWQQYSLNSKRLYEEMGDRFIEIDRKNGNRLYYK